MANIKDLKKKIKSTKGTLKITSAMKLVSAAKLNRAQHAVLNARPYARELSSTIQTIAALADNYSHSFLEAKESSAIALLVISADKGLCGAYNSQLSREVKKFLKATDKEVKLFFVGKKAMELLKDYTDGTQKTFKFAKIDPSLDEVKSIAQELSSLFISGAVGEVYAAYNTFNSAISFTPSISRQLPLSLNQEKKADLRAEFPFDFIYEPSSESILDQLIPSSYQTSLFTCFLDAVAAEHGARMSSMDSASKNCKKAIKSLTIKMNKVRQAAITTELIEVVSGAESLNS